MHRYLRLGALLCAAVIADRNLEESSLLQETYKPAQTNKRDTKPLTNLLESARGFLTNGATPDVVAFATETLNAVGGMILPTIVNETRDDLQWMQTELLRFQAVLTDLELGNHNILGFKTNRRDRSAQHHQCRASDVEGQEDEEMACNGKRRCEMELHGLWKSWEEAELNLRLVEEDFEKHFCPQCEDWEKDQHGACPQDHPGAVNGTLNRFRGHSYTKMESWTLHKKECDDAEEAYDAKIPICDEKNKALDLQSKACNQELRDLEDAACSHGSAVTSTLTKFHSAWSSLHRSYQGITDLIYNQTQDRMKEFKTLVVVQCLLERVHELNGRPCDETTGTVDEEMTECESRGHNALECVCSSNERCSDNKIDSFLTEDAYVVENPTLCQEFPAPPPTPAPCPQGDSGQARCIPSPESWPCESAWEAAEIESLSWHPPSGINPPFSAENPGCNAYPECNPCEGLGELSNDHFDNLGVYQSWVEPPASFELLHHATFEAGAVQYGTLNSLWDPDRDWGATVDGCSSINENPHIWEGDQTGLRIPLTVRSAESTAAVRCCSADGSDCTSQIGGVCWNTATFKGAQAICHNDGKRLCSQAEMDGGVCCDKGCWFDHYPVWIADGTAAQVDR